MIRKSCLYVFIIAALLTSEGVAQDTLPQKQIQVVKSYEPTTAEAVKIDFNPQLPKAREDFAPSLDYAVPSYPVNFGYQTQTIRALSMRKEELSSPGKAYVKGGFGNYTTPLIEGYYNSGHQKDYRYGGWASHISSNGPLENQKYSDNNLHIFGKRFLDNHTISADLDYHRRVHHLYGYNDSLRSFEDDSVKQRYSIVSGQVDFTKRTKKEQSLEYNGHFDFYYLGDYYQASEESYNWRIGGTKTLENGDDIVVNLSVNPITFKTDSTLIYSEGRYTKDSSLQRFFTTLNPKFIFRKPAWKMKFELGGKVTFINEEPEFLPDIYLSRKLYKTHVVYYSGWKGKIISNSYKQLMEKNPFITPVMPIKYSMSLNSYTGVKGHFADNFFYQLEFAYKNITNKPYFVNDSLDRKNFDVVYDGRTAILDFHAQLGYHLEDKAKVALQSHYKNYDLTDLEKPWHAPQFKLSLSGHYNIQDKIRLKADIFAWDKIYARVDGESQRLPFIFDANLQAQYRYLDNLSFFINLENLLGRYSRWYGYPNYGFHLIAGGILRF